MDASDDKHWAQRYLLDPLNAPDPSQETGPGSSFRPDSEVTTSPKASLPSPPTSPTAANRLSKNPYRKSSASSRGPPGTISSLGRSTSLTSKSPTGTTVSELPYRSNTQSHSRNTSGNGPVPSPTHRKEALGSLNDDSPPSNTNGTPGGRRRGSSLTSRFPGDKSHHPLATLAKEKHVADRSSHVTRKHQVRPDTIDSLDNVGGTTYHHSGPYDATLYARNNSFISSPVQAVAGTNAEALKATPRDKIRDAVDGHRPLDGVASFPPGSRDRDGHLYQYEEGDNMMTGGGHEPEGGAYKRWPGVQYAPDDIKGKGEPSYTIEKALKEKKLEERAAAGAGERDGSIEMISHPNAEQRTHRRGPNSGSGTGPRSPGMNNEMWGDGEGQSSGTPVNRSSSFSKRLSGGGLKKRFGSIKKHLQGDSG